MRKTLAIRGDNKRPSEVINILETLGGKNTANHKGDNGAYYINEDGYIIHFQYNDPSEFITYSLDGFKDKYPFKIDDSVVINGESCIISDMYWDGKEILYTVKYLDGDCEYEVKRSEVTNQVLEDFSKDHLSNKSSNE